ncbi:MAG: NAD(P)/FAD-dependent oxidoreductase, partial [Halobacteriaceae archaeon]
DEPWDAIVAGAGPAGTQFALDLARRDHDVLLLEASNELGQPPKSTGGTFAEGMVEFNIDDDVFQHKTTDVVLEAPAAPEDSTAFLKLDRYGGVLNFPKFKRRRAKKAEAAGAEIRTNARVIDQILDDDDKIIGVTHRGGHDVYGDLIIDATGEKAAIARDLGLRNLRDETFAQGWEYEMEGVDLQNTKDSMMLRLDPDVAPGGYAWIFHTGEDTAKVGVCWIEKKYRDQEGTGELKENLEAWIDRDDRLQNATKIDGSDVHIGAAYIDSYWHVLQQPCSTDNAMFVGDTVSSVDPIWGEGIYNCMQSGRLAAMVANDALNRDPVNTSANVLEKYDELWKQRIAADRGTRVHLGELLYSRSADRYNRLMRQMNQLDLDTLADIYEGKGRALAKVAELTDIPAFLRFKLNLVHDSLTESSNLYRRIRQEFSTEPT